MAVVDCSRKRQLLLLLQEEEMPSIARFRRHVLVHHQLHGTPPVAAVAAVVLQLHTVCTATLMSRHQVWLQQRQQHWRLPLPPQLQLQHKRHRRHRWHRRHNVHRWRSHQEQHHLLDNPHRTVKR